MSATQVETLKSSANSPTLHLTADSPPWIKDLLEDGFAIVKNAITPEQARQYADRAEDWLEGFGLGYRRDDKSTWHVDKLPWHQRGGLYSRHGIAHAQFIWDAKTEPGVLKLWSDLWGTEDLSVSFDGANLSVPLPIEEVELDGKPWPHVDQSPYRCYLHAVQGILNLLPNGAKDGGLAVMKGSSKLFERFFQDHAHLAPAEGWHKEDWHMFTEDNIKWYEDHGAQWIKPSLDPGDFILWDSRCIHYGAVPEEQNKRFAIYTCYKPASQLSEDMRKLKAEAFEKGWCTSHDPISFRVKPDQSEDPSETFPYGRPTLSQRAQKVAGLLV